MQDFANQRVLLGVCGGIAAYKTAEWVRELIRVGAEVRVVMTASALQFMTPLTFQALSGHDVRCDVFDTQAERAMGHIELARWASLVLIAPASADCLAKIAHGLADDLLSTLLLVTHAPVWVCPAMNHSMWTHPATQTNVRRLRRHGVRVVGPAVGDQACGEYGPGRMVSCQAMLTALRLQEVSRCLRGVHVLITAGPTREALDPVRYISNHSSGKMGYALAEAALAAGAHVTLITGPTVLEAPLGATVCSVVSAQEMFAAVMQHLREGTVFIGAAAVADYTLSHPALEKMKKQSHATLTLSLTKTTDIIAMVAASGKASWVVGFAAETHHVLAYAQEKLHAKSLDMVVANVVGSGRGFECEDNAVTVITTTQERTLPLQHKTRLAGQLIMMIAEAWLGRASLP